MAFLAAPASDRAAATRDAVRAAALEEFAQFGYRRTSMDGIARRAGVSRATVYLHWANKESLFRDIVETLHAAAFRTMSQAATTDEQPLDQRWGRMMAARFSRFVHLTAGSPVAGELIDTYTRLCADVAASYERRTRSLLTRTVRSAVDAGDLDLDRAGVTVAEVVGALEQVAHGAKAVSAEPGGPSYERAVQRAIHILLTGVASR